MKRRYLAGDQVCRGNLILVNKKHPLQSPEPADRVIFPGSGEELKAEAEQALERLVKAAEGEGELLLQSGYRTEKTQRELYADSLAENGPAYTAKYVAEPGCSEHQTGLAADMTVKGAPEDRICPEFSGESAVRFRKKAAEFGFIERYPAEKEPVTGIGAEPWHFRYVGVPHAGLMEQWGMTLEEYVNFLRKREGSRIICRTGGRQYEISYRKCPPGGMEIIVPADREIQVSGDNVGGCLITLISDAGEGGVP